MHRVVGLVVVAAAALVAASSVESAPARMPRFLATVTGTQHFAWTLEQSDLQCSFQGKGVQDETFRTARPVKVIAPRGKAGSYEFQAFSRGGCGASFRSPAARRATTKSCRGRRAHAAPWESSSGATAVDRTRCFRALASC